MFDSPARFSLKELDQARKPCFRDRWEFFRNHALKTTRPLHRTMRMDIPGRVLEAAEDGTLRRCRNMRVVTERNGYSSTTMRTPGCHAACAVTISYSTIAHHERA